MFRIGSGDCLAGCIEETVSYLNLYPDRQGYRIEKVDGPTHYHSLWGYPDRFPLRTFNDFDDLVKQPTSSDWSLRLHAVSALGSTAASRQIATKNKTWPLLLDLGQMHAPNKTPECLSALRLAQNPTGRLGPRMPCCWHLGCDADRHGGAEAFRSMLAASKDSAGDLLL